MQAHMHSAHMMHTSVQTEKKVVNPSITSSPGYIVPEKYCAMPCQTVRCLWQSYWVALWLTCTIKQLKVACVWATSYTQQFAGEHECEEGSLQHCACLVFGLYSKTINHQWQIQGSLQSDILAWQSVKHVLHQAAFTPEIKKWVCVCQGIKSAMLCHVFSGCCGSLFTLTMTTQKVSHFGPRMVSTSKSLRNKSPIKSHTGSTMVPDPLLFGTYNAEHLSPTQKWALLQEDRD